MKFTFLSITCFLGITAFAQPSHSDSVKQMSPEAQKMEALFARVQYPLIKSAKMGGVIPVSNPTEVPDLSQKYKLLIEDVVPVTDSLADDVAGGLAEAARLINLHIASGVPKKNLNVVVVVHGTSLYSLGTNEFYQKKFKMDNANIALINELKANGVKIIACGQAMAFHAMEKEDMLPDVKISLTAQTVLSNYQLKGYVWYPVTDSR